MVLSDANDAPPGVGTSYQRILSRWGSDMQFMPDISMVENENGNRFTTAVP